jgi:uncharacterized membrane protein HdeD (DUF308 family)
MNLNLIRNWWLLALSGVLQLVCSVLHFFMQRPGGSLAIRTSVNSRSTFVYIGLLLLSAGVCVTGATLSSSLKGKSWLLLMNGFAFTLLGLIFTLRTRGLSFRTIALLVALMSMSVGLYYLAADPVLRGSPSDQWLFRLAGAGSVGFALVFLAFAFAARKLLGGSPATSLFWIGSYFGFSAICVLFLALRLRSLRPSRSGGWGTFSSSASPKHAH